jgi:hypothetical protein
LLEYVYYMYRASLSVLRFAASKLVGLDAVNDEETWRALTKLTRRTHNAIFRSTDTAESFSTS